jgi:hypothetical protein
MKHFFSLSTIFFVLILSLNAQDFNYNVGQVGTTMEIYNYVTKGYSVQISSGLDMKKGYFLWEKFSRSTNSVDGQRNVKVNALIQESNLKVCAWMLIYQKSGSTPYYFCIPTQASDNEVWNKSFMDLRDSKLSTDAYLAYTWTLYNLVGQLSNDYSNICFTANTKITMADGTQKSIINIREGDLILSYDYLTSKPIQSEVSKLIVHEDNQFKVSCITVSNDKLLFASSNNNYIDNTFVIEATSNHPIVTTNGIKTIADLTTNDKLLYFDFNNNEFYELPIIKTEKDIKKVEKVYNIKLIDNINYIANNLVVMMK